MAKLRDEIASLQDDVSKSTDQVLQENRRSFLSRLLNVILSGVVICFRFLFVQRSHTIGHY